MPVTLSLIVAVADHHVIGYQNRLPWRISDDLKHFKRVTTGKAVIMGRTTYQSLPKPLKNRLSIVLTHNTEFTSEYDHVMISHSVPEALEYGRAYIDSHQRGGQEGQEGGEVIVAGGQHIYQQFWPWVTKLYLTRVRTKALKGDAFCDMFDELDQSWQLISELAWPQNQFNEYPADCYIYQRCSKEPLPLPLAS